MSLENFTINKNIKLPYYYQLYESLAADIRSNKIPEGHKLEPEMVLCDKYGLSRITVRQALKELELSGFIIRERGKGTYVRKKVETLSLQKVSSIVDELRRGGIDTRKKILKKELVSPDYKLIEIMSLNKSEKIFYIERFILAFEKPFYITKAYFPYSLTGKINNNILINNSFTAIITDVLNFKLVHSKRVLTADVPDKKTAELLEIAPEDKQVINYVQTFWTIVYKNKNWIIYFEEFFNSSQGKFVFEKTY
ncbi:MAG: GntR family transcriptional regulator [Actinobacteria bacterium]|nr:GntR family transcriptional regulator [Actinomycetota bacterium]